MPVVISQYVWTLHMGEIHILSNSDYILFIAHPKRKKSQKKETHIVYKGSHIAMSRVKSGFEFGITCSDTIKKLKNQL